jgi:hypothetical protein
MLGVVQLREEALPQELLTLCHALRLAELLAVLAEDHIDVIGVPTGSS